MKPEMIVIAGPSGSGKSRHFGAQSFGIAFFNVDDRCAELNGGSYHDIPVEMRTQAQRECEHFISDCTAQGTSFNLPRALAVFDQVALYDSSAHDKPPRMVRVYHDQRITFNEPPVPSWLAAVVGSG